MFLYFVIGAVAFVGGFIFAVVLLSPNFGVEHNRETADDFEIGR